MKKVFLFLAVSALLFSSCADEKTINGVTYRPYGFFNESECKNDSIQYETSTEAVISGVIFFETIVCPIYTFGYNLYQPVAIKSEFIKKNQKGVVK